MVRMKLYKLLCLFLVLGIFSACSEDDATTYNDIMSDAAGTSSSLYEGTWSIDGTNISTSELLQNESTFVIINTPYTALLGVLMPEKTISEVKDEAFSAAYDITGYSDQALYFNINKPTITLTANIDGVQRNVELMIGTFFGFNTGATATYSKLSDVFKIDIPISGYNVYDAESEELIESQSKAAELVFLTTKRTR